MTASMKVDLKAVWDKVKAFTSPTLMRKVGGIPQEKGILAIIVHAIADNFDKEGPGWPPLKAQTIRYSTKKGRKQVLLKGRGSKKNLNALTDEEILKHEVEERAKGNEGKPFRHILVKTGLLKKTVTVPNFTGSTETPSKLGKSIKTVTGSNIYRVEGKNIIWGTNLSYAAKHNKGLGVPKREFLVIREPFQKELRSYVEGRLRVILRSLTQGAG